MKAVCLFFCLIAAFSTNAEALSIVFDSHEIHAEIGETFSCDLLLSNNEDFVARAWSLKLKYDPDIVDFSTAAFGPHFGPLGSDQANTYYFNDSINGALYIDTYSFLDETELEVLQNGPLRLATIFFKTLSFGKSDLALCDPFLLNMDEEEIVPNLRGGTVTVESKPVPEPSTILLFGIGILALGGFKQTTQMFHKILRKH